ncbi:MAG: hypothetical protein WCA06_07300 [Terrimicrobiaceae bacterium]
MEVQDRLVVRLHMLSPAREPRFSLLVAPLQSSTSPESIEETLDVHATGNQVTRDEFIASLKEMTLLKRLPSLADVGHVATLMASDYAGTMTGTVANMTCGQMVD